MSQLARMFVVLNFLLAAGFLYAAAMFLGINHEWKKKHDTMTTQRHARPRRCRASVRRSRRLGSRSSRRSPQTLKEEGAGPQGQRRAADGRRTQHGGEGQEDEGRRDRQGAGQRRFGQRQPEARERRARRSAPKRPTSSARTPRRPRPPSARRTTSSRRPRPRSATRDNSIAELEKGKTDMTAQDRGARDREVDRPGSRASTSRTSSTPPRSRTPRSSAVDTDMKLVQVNAGFGPEGRSRHDARHRPRRRATSAGSRSTRSIRTARPGPSPSRRRARPSRSAIGPRTPSTDQEARKPWHLKK